VTNGAGDYYMVINKATGQVLANTGMGIERQAPGAPSNGDWAEPANRGQLWRIVPARITEVTTSASTTVGGTVPPTLSLTLGGPVALGSFLPGVARVYQASTTADVVSTAGDATLTWSGPDHLANGSFTLAQPLEVTGLPKTWDAPVSHDIVPIGFSQRIGANDPLRTGTYATTLTYTLSTTNP
jgi:hypothetical protein